MIFFRKGLLKFLVEDGYEVHIIAPKDYKTEEMIKIGCIYHQLDFRTKNINPFYELKLISDLTRLYKRINPKIVFHYTIKPNTYGSVAAKLAGVRSVAIITGLGYTFLNNNLVNKVVRILYKLTLRYASSVWFLNQPDKELMIADRIVDSRKVRLLPGEGVNTSEFSPIESNSNKNGFVFLMLSRMVWFKGINEYVEAAQKVKAEFPQVQFNLFGETDVDNPNSIPIEVLEKWHKMSYVNFKGLSHDVRNEIANADCVVLPSHTEGLSKVLMEAASMEKPLIATNLPGCKELIEEGVNGYLSELKNIDSLVEKMKKILSLDREELKKMGKIGRQKMINNYDEKIIIKYYMNFINEKD
jgi:glycosyltransferase involved in cell wall biosynthesis